jgi:hypothetical protein
MTKFSRDKRLITSTVLKELPFQPDDADLERSLKKWWVNIRDDGGLRLSHEGEQSFRMAGIEYWDLPCEDQKSTGLFNKLIGALVLDKFLNCPYYIMFDRVTKIYSIRVFDGRIASMIQLHGTLAEYIDREKRRDK